MDFHEVQCLRMLLKMIVLFEFVLRLGSFNYHFALRPASIKTCILAITHCIITGIKNVLDMRCREECNKYFMSCNF
jgi:hypothetical protein